VVAVLGVEASASYFQVLGQFRKTMMLFGGLSALFILAAGFLFFKLSFSVAQAEMAILRADALATLGQMAAHMAHEIRNPLSIIRGAVQRLSSSPARREADHELLSFLPEEVDRLDQIVSRYLDFARVEPLNLVDVDLGALAKETLSMARQELADRGVRVEIRAPERMSPVRLDRSKIKQALLNLLLNAAQAMPQGGEVRVAVSTTKKWIQLDVSDTGVGISGHELNKIFQPFYTTKEKGSGLGLAIVAKVVDDHRGRIQVRSQPNRGTTFSILLPLSQMRELGHGQDTGGR
jgi:two-component system sensor histidine kinase HydH